MNVALTQAKEQLYEIGDSATVGNDVFFIAFLTYVEEHGTYRKVWECELYYCGIKKFIAAVKRTKRNTFYFSDFFLRFSS